MPDGRVSQASPEVDELQRRAIVTSYARAHDLLDTYGVPRVLENDGVAVAHLTVAMRIEWFMREGKRLFTPDEERSAHMGKLGGS